MDCSFDSLLQWLFAKPFFLGDEYIVYYIQGLTSPTTAAREGTIVYLRVIIIWGLLQMLNFQYEKSDLCGKYIFNARNGEFSTNLQFVKLCKVRFWLDFFGVYLQHKCLIYDFGIWQKRNSTYSVT